MCNTGIENSEWRNGYIYCYEHCYCSTSGGPKIEKSMEESKRTLGTEQVDDIEHWTCSI